MSWVYAPNTFPVNGTSQNYLIDNNRGGGKFDYAVLAPTMDLSKWSSAATNKTYLFVADINFDELDGGFEEISISGGYTSPVIPEPVSAFLIGIGLLGLGIFKKRK